MKKSRPKGELTSEERAELIRLRREIHELKQERDFLKKHQCLLRQGICKNDYEVIKAEKANYPVAMMCRTLDVSKSGFYKWLNHKPSRRDKENRVLALYIKKLASF